MIESLKLIYYRVIAEVDDTFHRYLYSTFNHDDRLTGLIGARGVGKTTLLLQYIKKNFPNLNDTFYVSADHIYFDRITLYEFIENLYLTQGVTIFFIDEIHKYSNWNQEIKNLYDGFPHIKIVFSGSSSLDIVKGSYDLSRRAKLYHLAGMSLREYINFHSKLTIEPVDFNKLVEHSRHYDPLFSSIHKIKGYFQDYLKNGFYPFLQENPLSYYEKLLRVVDKTIYEDIANFYKLKTENLHLFKKILNFIVTIPPGKLSIHNLAKNLSIDDKTAANYLNIMQETNLINLIYADAQGNQLLRKPEKIFINNTNLHYALSGKISAPLVIGSVRELYFLQAIRNAGIDVFYSDQGDFIINDRVFEIGGKNKTRQQIKNQPNALLVKDDTMLSALGEIPLYYFGFLY